MLLIHFEQFAAVAAIFSLNGTKIQPTGDESFVKEVYFLDYEHNFNIGLDFLVRSNWKLTIKFNKFYFELIAGCTRD